MRDLGYLVRRALHELQGKVVHLSPSNSPKGAVLLSYTTLPFLDRRPSILDGHTNRWECVQMAESFLAQGYSVDVIDATNHTFVPKKEYRYFIDVGTNIDRLAPLLGDRCTKIFHITHAHWKYQNDAEDACISTIETERGVSYASERTMAPSRAIELCDLATSVAGVFANSTYAYAGKMIIPIPLSTTHTYPSPEHKNFDQIRNTFIWFGGAGLALKRLNLVLEAFARMPQYQLTVCGKVNREHPFARAYQKELFETPNIRTLGWVDPGTPTFTELCHNSLGVVYTSASEGCAGSVVLCMHAGLIPIVSYESGVAVSDAGMVMTTTSVETIMEHIRTLSQMPHSELQKRAQKSWQLARDTHTREAFTHAYNKFVVALTTNNL